MSNLFRVLLQDFLCGSSASNVMAREVKHAVKENVDLHDKFALYFTRIIHCISRQSCIVFQDKVTLYFTTMLHCISRQSCIVSQDNVALYFMTKVHCILRQCCIVFHDNVALYFTTKLHCISRQCCIVFQQSYIVFHDKVAVWRCHGKLLKSLEWVISFGEAKRNISPFLSYHRGAERAPALNKDVIITVITCKDIANSTVLIY